ncbi:uncharacterized protein EDB91DRAFT_1246249 [Suillus paluster]|uniref:uncharacterized protein n=1 Tax=Suillus paluster TaxID=48578 RepID=UPI001B87031E|nr:uncharacterized protein EDB91DRAFT_1246249 [Suillus paluster]KAG1745382.1 hypothetical protein EDB91DRAFT_1246249 [Suillus paluster]
MPKPQVLQANLRFIQHRAALAKTFPRHTQQQQVMPVPSVPPIMATSASAVVPQPSFHGDYKKEEEPTNWIRKYQLSLPPSYSDADKIARFELQCAATSPAEEWFTSLQAMDKATWVTFLAAFKIQWPPPVHAKLMVTQKKECLKSVVLKEEDIGVMIEKDRGWDWGHVKWAKQVAQMAQGFGDVHCHFLDVVLENTPKVLRDFLADHYTTWAEFEANMAKTSASQLNQTSSTRKTPDPSSSQAMQPSFSLPAAYRYGPRYIPNPTIPPQPAPPYQTIPPAPTHAQPLPAAPAPQTPQNPFSRTAPVPRTNLFYGFRGGYPQTPSRGRGASGADRA